MKTLERKLTTVKKKIPQRIDNNSLFNILFDMNRYFDKQFVEELRFKNLKLDQHKRNQLRKYYYYGSNNILAQVGLSKFAQYKANYDDSFEIAGDITQIDEKEIPPFDICLAVLEYAKELKVTEERKLKSLALANLLAIYLKRGIGSLSAFCGAISAGSAAGAAITYMRGGTREQIAYTFTNTLGALGGTVCDGAKSSCAAKIGNAVHAALVSGEMAFAGDNFRGGEGIIMDDFEDTINNIARLGRVGMAATDVEILNMMVGK